MIGDLRRGALSRRGQYLERNSTVKLSQPKLPTAKKMSSFLVSKEVSGCAYHSIPVYKRKRNLDSRNHLYIPVNLLLYFNQLVIKQMVLEPLEK